MQCLPNIKSTWIDGQAQEFTVTLYSLVAADPPTFAATEINLTGVNVNFVSFDENNAPVPTFVSGETPGPLNFKARFQGCPTATNKWVLKFKCIQRSGGPYGTDAATIKIFGFAEAFVPPNDPFNKEVRITLADPQGVISKPIKPKKFKARTLGTNAIELTWARVDYADEIIVERAITSNFSGTVYEWRVPGSDTSYVDYKTSAIESTVPSLAANTQYYYRIKGTNSMDDGDVSDTATATTIATPDNPSPPTDVRAVTGSGRSIKLSFNPTADLVVKTSAGDKVTLKPSYRAEYSLAQGGPYTVFGDFQERKNIEITGLDPNTTYYAVVKSSYTYAPAAVSSNSNEDSATTANINGAPAAVTGFTGTISDFTTVDLVWNNNNNSQATYDIFRAAGAATNPYVQVVTGLAATATSYSDAGLSASTQYFYRIRAVNNVGPGPYATFNITTDALPVAPSAPGDLDASPISDASISLNIHTDAGGSAFTSIEVFRANVTGGPYTSVGEIAATDFDTVYNYVDDNDLAPNATYFYVAKTKNRGGSSSNSPEASATTFARSETESPVSEFTFSPGSSCDIIQIGTRAVFISDMDRMIVYTNRAWFKGGLKRQLNAPVLAAASGGALAAGTYTVYTVLYSSKRSTRSLPSDGSEVTVTANQTIRITPDIDSSGATDIVLVRDEAFDYAGNQILAADYVEFYIASAESAFAFLVATIPVNDPVWDSPGYYELPATLTKQAIFGSQRRPMEILGESSLPPVCAHGYAKDNRLILFGEKTFTPTKEETAANAAVVINTGDRTFTTTNYPLTDGMIYHELYLNGSPTGWEIYDVDEDTDTAYIRNADPDIEEQGFRGLGGSFSDFNFAARASRVYYSAFFTGEADGSTTFSPETFPPLTHFEAEFFPQDNTDPNAIITSNADLIVGKPSKMMLVRGGSEPDFPLINVISLSQSSGLNAPNTICRDSRDNVYYLGDSGPFVVSASGVTKLNVQSGNQNLFQQIFDINSVDNAQGTWYSQQDWMVVAGLNRRNGSGFKDGFIYDPQLQLLCPFSTPYQITWMEEVKNVFGQYQIMFGDAEGRLGILFKPGLSADGIDYSVPAPSVFAIPISGYMRGPVFQTMNRICVRSFQPQIFMQNGATANCTFSVAKKDRMDDPFTWIPQKVVQFDTDDKRTYFSVAPHSYQNMVVEFGFTLPVNPTNARMSWREIVLEIVNRGPI